MTRVVQLLIDAASLGGLYALYALGIALIFGIMRLINFAHASLILVSGYTMALTGGLALPVRVVAALAVTVVAALLIDRVAFRPVRGQSATTLLVTSFAVFIVITSLAETIFGALPRSTTVSRSMSGTFSIGGLVLRRLDVAVLFSALALLGLVALLLNRTRIGIQMRAVAEDLVAARLMGIPVESVIRTAFSVSAVLAASAGILLLAQTGTVTPAFGLNAVLVGLVATVLGGLSDLRGAVLGGFALGIFSHLVQAMLPLEVRAFRDSIVFGVVFIVLVLKPEGLFSHVEGRV